MDNNCLQCSQTVRPRQEGLLCDGCQRWCHRTCGTGVTRTEYRIGCRTGYIDWECETCASVRISIVGTSDDIGTATCHPNTHQAAVDTYLEFEVDLLVETPAYTVSVENNPPVLETLVFHPLEQPNHVTYHVLEGASRFGKDILVDSLGYRYNIKVDKRRTATTWRCCHRTKNFTCKATVMYRDGVYVRGTQHHVCTPKPGHIQVLEIHKDVNSTTEKRFQDSVANLTEQVLLETVNPSYVSQQATLPKSRQGNLKKRKLGKQMPHFASEDFDRRVGI